MIALFNRHLRLYFRNKSNVFFSLLGALIAFVLYLVFLQKAQQGSLAALPEGKDLLNLWVMGGVLAVTSITTTWTGAAKLVLDRERQVWDDFILTDVKPWQLRLSYLLSASVIGFLMQLAMLALMLAYFTWQDGLSIPMNLYPQLVGLALLSSLLFSLLAVLVLPFITSSETESRVATIIGTAAGFLVGVYMPLGDLPDLAQNVMKLTPGLYVAALYRQLLMTEPMENIAELPTTFAVSMGIDLKWGANILSSGDNLLILLGLLLVLFLLFLLMSLVKRLQKR